MYAARAIEGDAVDANGNDGWRAALENLYSKGHINRGDLDDRIMSDIEGLPDEEAACVIRRVGETDMSHIRNISGFVGGIIRRVKADGPDRGEANIESLPQEVQKLLDGLIDDVRFDLLVDWTRNSMLQDKFKIQ